MSEMDSQRALLDTLMGINRNLDREEDEITDWRDKRVCKCFLAGLCPHGRRLHLFINIAVECLVYLFCIEPIEASSPNSPNSLFPCSDLFQNTKADLGACKLIHSEKLREDFESNVANLYQFDDYLEKEFSSYVNEADRKSLISHCTTSTCIKCMRMNVLLYVFFAWTFFLLSLLVSFFL